MKKLLGGKKPLPLIIGAVVLVAALILGGRVLGGAKPAKNRHQTVEVGASLPLEEFLVNLDGGGDHYLRATITLGMRKGITDDETKEKVAPIRDAILSVLSSQTLDGLSKSKARDELKETIRQKANEALGADDVVKVYFTSFATQ